MNSSIEANSCENLKTSDLTAQLDRAEGDRRENELSAVQSMSRVTENRKFRSVPSFILAERHISTAGSEKDACVDEKSDSRWSHAESFLRRSRSDIRSSSSSRTPIVNGRRRADIESNHPIQNHKFIRTPCGLQVWPIKETSGTPWTELKSAENNNLILVESIMLNTRIQGRSVFLKDEEVLLQDLIALHRNFVNEEFSSSDDSWPALYAREIKLAIEKLKRSLRYGGKSKFERMRG